MGRSGGSLSHGRLCRPIRTARVAVLQCWTVAPGRCEFPVRRPLGHAAARPTVWPWRRLPRTRLLPDLSAGGFCPESASPDHDVTPQAPWTGSGWREYSYGGVRGGPALPPSCHARWLCRLVWLAYSASWQPRLPDPSYASPALVVVPEDKSGTALAWIFFPSIVISSMRWPGAGTRPPEQRHDVARQDQGSCPPAHGGNRRAVCHRPARGHQELPGSRSRLVLQREMVLYRLQRYGPDFPVG